MKQYSHTALGLLLCSATVTGCYSERIKYIEVELRGDAGTPTKPLVEPPTTDPSESTEVKPKPRTDDDTSDVDTSGSKRDTEATDDDSTEGPTGTVEPVPSVTSDGETSTIEAPPPEDSFLAPLPVNHGGGGGETGDLVDSQPANAGSSPSPGTPPATPGTSDEGGSEAPSDQDSLQEVITEADILKRDGDIVYALSYVAGLSVIDVSNPANLVLLGSRRFEQTPFEMYLDGDEAVVLFYGSNGSYYSDYYGGYVDTTEKSKIGVYDVTNPGTLTEVDSAEIEGSLIDSRKVGDRLYVATNSYCYWCDNGSSRVGSFNLAGSGIAPVDEVEIPDEGDWSYAPTLYVNDKRLYLARTGGGYVDAAGNPVSDPGGDSGATSDGEGTFEAAVTTTATAATGTSVTGSATTATTPLADDDGTIESDEPPLDVDGGSGTSVGSEWRQWSSLQVVDISDNAGDLVLGANVHIEGEVNNRWQMDEHEGVLRVISQNGWWGPEPVVETFTVSDSATVTPLGRTPLTLPRPESLRSVRFDGNRAFAVTFERTDPLFTLDLSNPAAPKQVGMLEMPGYLYHMIPRGNRLYAVGYDNNAEGSLHASVFDVSDLANPQLLSRVNFGGDWGWFGEDQDRIEKSVQLLDEQGLMLIPFTGYDYEGDCGWGEMRSGVQLIDFTADALTLRGATEAIGYARRAFYHRDHLFGYSDRALQSFDISDRDQPVAVDALALGWSVESVAVVGDKLVRIGNDGLDHPVMDIVPVTQPNAPLQSNALALREESCGYGYYAEPILHDGKLLLPRQGYDYTTGESIASIAAFDVSGASGPSLIREVELPRAENSYGGAAWVQANNALVALQVSETWEWVSTSGGADGGAPVAPPTATPVAMPAPAVAPAVAPTPVATAAPQPDVDATESLAGDAGAPQWNGSGSYDYDYDYGYSGYTLYSRSARVNVVDLRDVASGMAVTTLDVPQDWVDNGFGRGPSNVTLDYASPKAGTHGLVAGGNVVAGQHVIQQDDGLRYYIDRLNVTNPAAPRWMSEANIPGAVLALAPDDVHLVTVDEVVLPLSEAECVQHEDFVACYNRATELSALTLESERAVRTEQLRLGSTRQWFSLAVDDPAVYVKGNGETEVRAYSQRLEERGQMVVDGEDYTYLNVVAGHAASFGYSPRGYTLYSTSGGAMHSVGFLDLSQIDWCGNWALRGTEAYCADGYDGVLHTTLE